MQSTEYSEIWLNLTVAALSLIFIRGHKTFPASSNYWVTLQSRSTFQNLESTMWLAKLGKGMLFSVEQAFVVRDEIRAPLNTTVWEANLPSTGCPSQMTLYCHLQAQVPEPSYRVLLGNETGIKKQMKILKLKNVNERIRQIRKKCLIIQTFDIWHKIK